MAGTYKKNPNYVQDSQEFAECVRIAEEEALAEARAIISQNAKNAASRLVSLLADHQDPTIQLNSSKHILKLVGMEVEQVSHSGKVEFEPLHISRGEA